MVSHRALLNSIELTRGTGQDLPKKLAHLWSMGVRVAIVG